jgi:hypothetical protein
MIEDEIEAAVAKGQCTAASSAVVKVRNPPRQKAQEQRGTWQDLDMAVAGQTEAPAARRLGCHRG